MDCAARRIAGRKGLHPETRAWARRLVPSRSHRCPSAQRDCSTSACVLVGLGWKNRPLPRCSPSFLQPDAVTVTCGPWSPLLVHRLGLSLPPGPPIHPIGSGPRACSSARTSVNTRTCVRMGHVRVRVYFLRTRHSACPRRRCLNLNRASRPGPCCPLAVRDSLGVPGRGRPAAKPPGSDSDGPSSRRDSGPKELSAEYGRSYKRVYVTACYKLRQVSKQTSPGD